MTFLDIISIFVVVANLLLGFFVWWKGKKKKANIWFFLLTIAVAGWVATNWLTYFFLDYSLINIFGRLTYAFSILIAPLFLQFVYIYFPRKKIIVIDKIIVSSVIALSVVLVVLCVSTNLIQLRPIIVKPHIATLDHGILYPLFFIYFILSIAYGFIMLIQRYQNSFGIEKQKIGYILLGFGISAFIGTVTNLFFETAISNYYWRALISMVGPIATIVLVVSIFYTIIRYRFFDIKFAIRKGVIYFISIALVLFIYLYLLIFIQRSLQQHYGWQDQNSILVLVLVIVLTIEPLRRFLFRIIDKAFYAKRKSAREEARKLRLVLSSSLQFDQLVQKIAGELQSFLDVTEIQFLWHDTKIGVLESFYPKGKGIVIKSQDPFFNFLREHPGILVTEEIPYMEEEINASEAEQLHSIEATLHLHKIGLVLPVGEKGELIGAFLLSPKHGKEAFTSDNIEYLSSMQFQMTNAIASALLYKQAVERIATIR